MINIGLSLINVIHNFSPTRLHSVVGSVSNCISRGCKFELQLGHITFVEIDGEMNIISTAILVLSRSHTVGYS